jgi:hypothetical protein
MLLRATGRFERLFCGLWTSGKMTIGETVRKLLFGEIPEKCDEDARNQWREAIHENRNETQKSVAEARKSRKASDEATRVAEWAVKILEGK